MSSFLESLPSQDRKMMEEYRKTILKTDKKVKEKTSKIMRIENALVYEEDGVFKYGLAQTKNYFTYHSMVMYSNPAIYEFAQQLFSNAKIQKGCINFTSFASFPIASFKELMARSSKTDFSPIVQHYKKRQK